jgi:hypothetical protein
MQQRTTIKRDNEEIAELKYNYEHQRDAKKEAQHKQKELENEKD